MSADAATASRRLHHTIPAPEYIIMVDTITLDGPSASGKYIKSIDTELLKISQYIILQMDIKQNM